MSHLDALDAGADLGQGVGDGPVELFEADEERDSSFVAVGFGEDGPLLVVALRKTRREIDAFSGVFVSFQLWSA